MNQAGGIAEDRPALLSSTPVAIGLILALAIATRIVAWWNPVAHVDDQFYLFAGEELLHGRWPYLDIWDRKPLGLFVLYAGIAAFGGSILGLNLVATAFASATAFVIRKIALRFANAGGATLAALSYLLVIPLLGGQTGQSPVFYNLLMALAAWQVFKASDEDVPRPITRHALYAMLLCGIALAIKQATVIEGSYFGLAFLWMLHRASIGWMRLAAMAIAMVALALMPTALGLAVYALKGTEALDAQLYAMFVSIFDKSGWTADVRFKGVLYFLLNLTPLILFALAGAQQRWSEKRRAAADFLLIGWMISAFMAYLAIPHFFDHYALPLIVPLAISAATFFARPSGSLFWLTLAIYSIAQRPILDLASNAQGRATYAQLARVVEQSRSGGCLFIGDGPARLYAESDACRVSRYAFPDHLNQVLESAAVGVDTRVELARILASRPAVIVTADRDPRQYSVNYQNFQSQLPRTHRLVFSTSRRGPHLAGIRVWQRRDLAPADRI